MHIKAALEDLETELTSPEMVDQINIVTIPSSESIKADREMTIASVTEGRKPTLEGTIKSLPCIEWKIFLEDMSSNDHYVVSESTRPGLVIVIVNRNHPYWSTQLRGSESVRDYLRQCVYDAVAESQARQKASRIDPDTVKHLKDSLLRVPLQIESHGDSGSI